MDVARPKRFAMRRNDNLVAFLRKPVDALVGLGQQRGGVGWIDPAGDGEVVGGRCCLQRCGTRGGGIEQQLPITGDCDNTVGSSRLSEHNEDGTVRAELDRQPCLATGGVIDERLLDAAGVRPPQFGGLGADAERNGGADRRRFRIGDEVDVGAIGSPVGEPQRDAAGEVGRDVELRFRAQPGGELPDFVVAARVVLHAGRTGRERADNGCAALDERADFAEQFGTHRGLFRQHEGPVGCAVRQFQQPALDNEFLLDDIGVDVVEIAARRQIGFADAGHFRRVFADEIGDISDARALLQQPAAPAEVVHPSPALFEPSVVAVELGAKPRVDAGAFVFPRLVDIDVKHEMVDPFAERPVAARLQRRRRVLELRAAGECLGGHERFVVDVGAGGSGSALDGAEVASNPKLAADEV